ncbi:MAG: WYL domain-containing protein [Actinobacteria bacterium]|nr:WYL domain-containing protein [Actinomycetota bacterium]
MVQIDTEWGRRAVVRLGGVIDDHVGFGTMHLESGSLALPELWRATNECRVVSMRYNAKDRTVHPYGLLSRDGYWYLGAYDLSRKEEVVFRVDRIQGDVVIGATPQAFVRRADYKLADAMPADAKLFDGADEQAVVRIDKVLALTVARELGQSGVILTHKNGDIDVRVSCANRVAFRAWLFAMVDRAEVLSPPNVRQEVIGWLNEVATGI